MGNKINKCLNCGEILPPYAGSGPKRKYCAKTSCNSQGRKKNVDYSVTRLKWSWTKYGGSRDTLRKEKLDKWNCQSCGREFPGELPGYMFPLKHLNDKEFARICSDCQFIVMRLTIEDFFSLVGVVRKITGIINL